MAKLLGLIIEDNFDYGHFIPNHHKCYTLHGHSAKVKIRVLGYQLENDMLIDFGELKKIVKNVINEYYDHKLIVSKNYVKDEENGLVNIQYRNFHLLIPKESVYMIEGEATSENIVKDICEKILDKLPKNIVEIHVAVSEGYNKGAYAKLKRK
jgi:6-pyruvoyltetrahydropterin/6-carboxytetrahydropterin synthase